MNKESINSIAFFEKSLHSSLAGIVGFHQCNKDTKTLVKINLSGFIPNTKHAIHIHESGDLSKGCESACAHYNPHNKLHGSLELYGTDRHVGDLSISNLVSDKAGKVIIEFEDDLVDLFPPFSIVGRMVVIHNKEDDLGKYRDIDSKKGMESGKTGNAGSRIACAIIGLTKTNYHTVG